MFFVVKGYMLRYYVKIKFLRGIDKMINDSMFSDYEWPKPLFVVGSSAPHTEWNCYKPAPEAYVTKRWEELHIPHLKKKKSTMLYISTELNDEGLKQICAVLESQECPITKLTFASVAFTKAQMEQFSQSLNKNRSLNELILKSCVTDVVSQENHEIVGQTMVPLLKVVQAHNSLSVLELIESSRKGEYGVKSNQVQQPFVNALASLIHADCLTALRLEEGCKKVTITSTNDKEIVPICAVLESQECPITKLTLDSVSLKKDQMERFSQSLNKNRSLNELSVISCAVDFDASNSNNETPEIDRLLQTVKAHSLKFVKEHITGPGISYFEGKNQWVEKHKTPSVLDLSGSLNGENINQAQSVSRFVNTLASLIQADYVGTLCLDESCQKVDITFISQKVDITPICEALESTDCSIKELKLSETSFTNAQMSRFSEAIGRAKSLKTLRLNCFDDEGIPDIDGELMVPLLKAVKNHDTLSDLDLTGSITDNGCLRKSDGGNYLEQVQHVSSFVRELAELIQADCLETLCLMGSVNFSFYSKAELQLIGRALEKTTRLREFNFCIDSITMDDYVDSSEVVVKKNYSTMVPLFFEYFKKNTSIEAFTLFGETEQAKPKWEFYLKQFAAITSENKALDLLNNENNNFSSREECGTLLTQIQQKRGLNKGEAMSCLLKYPCFKKQFGSVEILPNRADRIASGKLVWKKEQEEELNTGMESGCSLC